VAQAAASAQEGIAMAEGDRRLVQLTRSRAVELLGSVRVGRLAFSHEGLPAIRPVNHLVEGESVLVRATPGAAFTLASGGYGIEVAYEADAIDEESRLGWSVIVRGTARLLDDQTAAERYRTRLRPWISGAADDVITISADVVTGYRLAVAEPVRAGSG
jgi:nitroimidazol reductase NimA-like FMN-containing flavoprotein (pyridoxamine 5'-phosphate oxidase superfamily)